MFDMKRITAALMAAVLAAGIISGCGADKDGSGADTSGKGRYVEKDMEFPLQSGESFLSMHGTEAGGLVLFAADSEQVIRYGYDGKEWERTPLDWTKELLTEETVSFVDAEETADGAQYILTSDNAQIKSAVARRNEDGKTEKLDIPWLEQETGSGFYPMVHDLLVDESGNLWMMDLMQNTVMVVDCESSDIIREVQAGDSGSVSQKVLFHGEEGAVAVYTGQGSYTIYDGETGEENGSIQTESARETGFALSSRGENWYQISESGISRMQAGNDIEEVIMDGGSGAMGSPLNTVKGMAAGADEDFYAVYMQPDAGTCSLEHYVYDPDIASVPEKTLTVFGLTKNDSVQQAVTQFQKENPDVKVEYNTTGRSAGEITADDIRTLNTEILSGNGADVIMLDGLPTDSYVEKGILKDMTSLAEEILGSAGYMETIMENAAQYEGKIYGLPVKFSVPLIYGDEDVIKALESLESLTAYLKADPDASVFGSAGYDYIRDVLFQLYQEEIIDGDGKVDQEKLTQLFTAAGIIAENAKAAEAAEVYYQAEAGSNIQAGSAFSQGGDGIAILSYEDAVGTADVGSLSAMMIPYAVIRQAETEPASIEGMYTPRGIAGINSAAEQPELAEKFVRFLFGEEIQSAALTDGFPVLASALEGKIDSADDDSYAASVMMAGEGGNEIELQAKYPTREETEKFVELCRTLDQPVEQNRIVWNIYREEADKYLEGSVDADEAAKEIAQKVDTYLAE